tara:strand:+ start:157 stop:711 length:555 start_codon:yes stop_codon:yes gene_type:complete
MRGGSERLESNTLDDFNLIQKKKMEHENLDELKEFMNEQGFIRVKKFKQEDDYTDLQIYIINPKTIRNNIRDNMEYFYPEKWYMRYVEQYGNPKSYSCKLFLTDEEYIDFNVIFNKQHIYYISEKPKKPINYNRYIAKSNTRLALECFIKQYEEEKEKITEEELENESREEILNDKIKSWLKGW